MYWHSEEVEIRMRGSEGEGRREKRLTAKSVGGGVVVVVFAPYRIGPVHTFGSVILLLDIEDRRLI